MPGTTMLIVDDDPAMRKILAAVAKMLGCIVVAEAEDGKQAIDAYKHHQPDIVLMDINMPVLDGISALREIKQINNQSCVIVLTSEKTIDSVMQAIMAGASAYVIKGTPADMIANEISTSWKNHLDQLSSKS